MPSAELTVKVKELTEKGTEDQITVAKLQKQLTAEAKRLRRIFQSDSIQKQGVENEIPFSAPCLLFYEAPN